MKASVFVGTSLDGFIARADGSFDFLPVEVEPHGYEEFMATVDALVIGRKTFETALGFDEWAYGKKPVFVLSSRSIATPPPGAVVQQMSGAPADIVSQLEARGIQHIYVDGGLTIQRFLQAGLIHRLIITFRCSSVRASRCLARYGAISPSNMSPLAIFPAALFRVSMLLPPNKRLKLPGARK